MHRIFSCQEIFCHTSVTFHALLTYSVEGEWLEAGDSVLEPLTFTCKQRLRLSSEAERLRRVMFPRLRRASYFINRNS